MIQYKIDILKELNNKGYTSYNLRKEKLLAESTIQKLRNNQPISWKNINAICNLLECQPGDLLTHKKDA